MELKVAGIGISQDVISLIVSRTVENVEGVASVGVKDLATNFAQLPPVEARVVDDKLAITVRVVVFFGYPFKKLAEVIREHVVAVIDAQVGVDVASVDVCIDGLVFPKE